MPISLHADQVGSLLRPQELLDARNQVPPAPDRLRELEDRHVARVLARQRDLGFEVVTDGELRRRNFMSDFTDAVDGFDLDDATPRDWQAGGTGAGPVSTVAGIVTSRLRAVRRLTAHELPFLQAHASGTVKITLPSANQFPAIAFKRGVTDRVYPDHSALLWDVVEILKQELRSLAADGVSYLQLDAPRYSYYVDPTWRDWIQREIGIDPDVALDEAVRADNACLDAARREGVTLAIHLCRGNNRSQWYAEGGYDAVADAVFGGLHVDRFLLEYDDDRSGTFEPLRLVPSDKAVVLGLVSSKRPGLEDPDELAARVDAAARVVPLERLALSTQCGFASTAEGNLLSEDDQWAKLELVVDTARHIWA